MQVLFGEWLPDLPDYQNPGLVTAKNCLPQSIFYKQFNSLSEASTSSVVTFCLGAFAAQKNDLTSFLTVGTASKLWHLKTDNTFEDLSKVGGYTGGSDDCWNFTQMGTTVVATNFADNVQSFVLGSSSAYADLAGSPPKARAVTNIRGFVVLAGTSNSPFEVIWSDFNAPTSWSGGLSNSTTLDASVGSIVNVVGGEYGVIFCNRGIFRMNYIGSPFVFEFALVEKQRGLLGCNAWCEFGNLIFFLGQDGFYWFDGTQSKNISNSKLTDFFFSDVDLSFSFNISCAIDYINNIIMVLYPSTQANGGTPNRMLAYDVNNNKWTYIDGITADRIFLNRTQGYVIDAIDAIYSTIDSIPFTIDSKFWFGGSLSLAAISSNHKLATFSGDPLTATFETGSFTVPDEEKRSMLLWAKPLITNQSNVTLSIGSSNDLSDAPTYSAPVLQNRANLFPIRTNATFLSAKLVVSGGFDSAQGIEFPTPAKGSLQ